MKNLYLFDIDGTLVDSTPLHLKAFQKSYKEEFGVDVNESHWKKNFGKTAMNFHTSVCKDLGIAFSEEKFQDMIVLWEKYVTLNISKLKPLILPGVLEFIDELKEKGELLGIVTGNPEVMGKLLLKKAGLLELFEIESYSDETIHERSDLIRNALFKAKELGEDVKSTIVIGDTPVDVMSGKKMNALSVGVTTSYFSEEALKNAGADIVLKNLSDYEKIIRSVAE